MVDTLRDVSLRLLDDGLALDDVLKPLERSRQPLLRRIAFHVVAEQVRRGQGRARDIARSWLLDPNLLDVTYRHEYSELARAALPQLGPGNAALWCEIIQFGPPAVDDTELRDRAAHLVDESRDIDGAVALYREIWRHGVLSAIGSEGLPEEARADLSVLDEQLGRRHHADFPTYMSDLRMRYTSPYSIEELQALQPGEVIAVLRDWRPSDPHCGDSVEGLARTLQSVVRAAPLRWAGAAVELSGLDPTYVRALLTGFEEAVREGVAIPWEPAIYFCDHIAQLPDDGSETSGDLDRDVVWRYAQRAAADLLDKGLSRDDDASIPRQ
ncbi:MAG: hypothetical protein ACRDRT_17520, partial [Pseudonocardiaceae bacterium]